MKNDEGVFLIESAGSERSPVPELVNVVPQLEHQEILLPSLLSLLLDPPPLTAPTS